jgi:hypothetical protein
MEAGIKYLVLCAVPFMFNWSIVTAPARAQDASSPAQSQDQPQSPAPSLATVVENPPLIPDTMAPFTTQSKIAATIEFSLRALAEDIAADIPRRLATIDERVQCVHRRVLVFRVNANCDIYGFVERSGPVSLYGRGNRVHGSVPIYGALEGQGANRFTSRIHGETEARAIVEAEARPQLARDWSLDLNISDGFRWSEPPVLNVLGREISVAKYAEPRIRAQLARVRSRARAAARRLDLHGKAASAWRQAFEPVKLSDSPEIWLQHTPQSAAFAGVRANAKVLQGSLELSGSADTVVGQHPASATATELPPLGQDVNEPGEFAVILPVRIGYDLVKDKITQAIAGVVPVGEISISDVQVYPSSGRLVVGLHIAKASDTDPNTGQWVYLTGAVQVDADRHAIRLSDLGANVATADNAVTSATNLVLAALRDKLNVDYGVAYQNLVNAANEKLTRPLKDGFRMEGRLSSAKLEKVYLPADGIVIVLRAGGELKILYGL